MNQFKMKPLLIAIGLGCMSASAFAHVHSPKLDVNSINDDRVVAAVSFDAPVVGDLYLATELNGTLYFLTPGPVLTTTPTAAVKNGSFSADIPVLDIPAAGLNPGNYPLYQVVTAAGADPLNFNNWVGGINGLSKIMFNINLANTAPTAVPTTTPVVDPPPAPTTTPVV
ncbi:MAG: hypothetical protein ABL903_05425, partial [Methylococcales bacterium]